MLNRCSKMRNLSSSKKRHIKARNDRVKARGILRRSVRNKVKRLQRLIPGGRELQPESLFLRTADYILLLRLQVNVLQALSKFYKQP